MNKYVVIIVKYSDEIKPFDQFYLAGSRQSKKCPKKWFEWRGRISVTLKAMNYLIKRVHVKYNYRFLALATTYSGENVSILNRCLIKSHAECGYFQVRFSTANLVSVNSGPNGFAQLSCMSCCLPMQRANQSIS